MASHLQPNFNHGATPTARCMFPILVPLKVLFKFPPFCSEWHLSPKQDHLVCFLAGSLMLGAATTGSRGAHVSRPPVSAELTVNARVEWTVGEELLRTCVETHKTATCVFFSSSSSLDHLIDLI